MQYLLTWNFYKEDNVCIPHHDNLRDDHPKRDHICITNCNKEGFEKLNHLAQPFPFRVNIIVPPRADNLLII